MTTETSLVQASTDMTKNSEIQKRLAALKKMKVGINIVPNYKEFNEKDELCRGVFIGFVEMELTDSQTGEVKILQCAAWIDENQNCWQNGGKALVSAFAASGLAQYTPIEIQYLGEKKVAKGTMKQYAVRPLAEAA